MTDIHKRIYDSDEFIQHVHDKMISALGISEEILNSEHSESFEKSIKEMVNYGKTESSISSQKLGH